MILEACHHNRGECTITIQSLHAQGDGSEVALRLTLDNGEHREERRLVLTTEQYCDLKPCRGVICEELFEKLEEADRLCAALRNGENILSFGANSVQMLSQKLMRRGFDREVARTAAHRLEDMGLIDEGRDLRRELEKCLRKLWGARRIQAHLWGRGFAAEAMAELPGLLAEVDFETNCTALIRKHYVGVPTDDGERRRMIASLSRYGYTISEIRAAIKSIEK